MSVKIMGAVWDAELPRDEKFVLLAYADHADHNGNNIFPSIGFIAWKTGYSKRSVQRITRKQRRSWVLDQACSSGPCDSYEHVSECRALLARGLPVLCERVSKDEQAVYQHRGQWADVLRSRVEVG